MKRSEHMERGGYFWRTGFLLVNIFVYWPHVLAQEDDKTGIHWIPDDNYTSTGIPCSIDVLPTTKWKVISLRYFPRGEMNCYTLDVSSGSRYLIRGTHVYLNHVGINRPPEFDVAIDATIVFSVKTIIDMPQVHEVIVTAIKRFVNYCLLTREGFPVISALEMRPFPCSYYTDATHGFLFPESRFEFGDILQDIRYPQDTLDKTWTEERRGLDIVVSTENEMTLHSWFTNTTTPYSVFASERAADCATHRFEYTSSSRYTANSFIFLLYFELNSAAKNWDGIVQITANGMPVQNYDVLESHPLFSQDIVQFSVAGTPALTVVVEVAAIGWEISLIAVEVYQFVSAVEGCQDSDVQALMGIKKHLNLVAWSGDPCLPVSWDGVACEMPAGEYANVVTGLDLSNQKLIRLVLNKIGRLSYLKQLQVEYDTLHGEIPSKLTTRHANNLRYRFFSRRLLNEFSSSKTSNLESKGNNDLLKTFIGALVGTMSFLVLMTVTIIGYCYCKHRAKVRPPVAIWTGDTSNGPNYIMKSPLQNPMDLEMQSNRPQELSLKEVQTVTEKFKSKIGEGGFGAVYYGTLSDGCAVAVKVRSLNSNQGTREFTTELELLRKIQHENLVPLVGFCTEYQQQILIYPYMSNGSLHDRLHDKTVGRKPLDWQTRLSIVLGAARGINFLHTGGERCIIHRDVKSSNILLDDSMQAKIADFGLSKYSPIEDESLVSTEVRGTAEYLDPEYYQTHQLTEMSDVYSFGIVLLETVCGREPLNMNRPRNERSLLEWVRPYIKDANIQQIVDPDIQSYTPESLWRVLEIALQSVEPHSSRRPAIAYIVRELEDALIIENNASQYMASIQSLDSLCIPSIELKEVSVKEPLSYPLTFPFEPSPVFSETMNIAPDPR